jgi:Nuclease-related domain
MRIITNDKIVKRNAAIGKYATIAGLVILVGGVAVSYLLQSQNITDVVYQWIPFATLIIGFILSNVGTYYMNRFGREPRSDTVLEGALKGFDDKYRLYNYYLPGSHFLVAPTGIYAITPKAQAGAVEWDGKRWKHKNSNILMSLFGQDNLANPNAEAAADADNIARFLSKKVGGDVPPVQSIIVFTNPKVEIKGDAPPLPTLHIKQLKEHLRKMPKASAKDGSGSGPGKQLVTLNAEQLSKLDETLGI